MISEKNTGSLGRLFVAVVLALVSFLPLFSQETTLDNHQGLWQDDATWTDASSPGNSSISSDVHIYGSVVSGASLDFSAGNLFVHDTLTIFGNLTLGDTLDLNIDPAGILIIRGDFTANDTVDVWSGGQMVVTGEFSILGDNDQGSFDNDGVLYVFDATPTLKTGTGYGDFTCGSPVDSCSLYNETDLLAGPLASLFLSGSYEIAVSGPLTFCAGDSVILSVTDTATSYQWFANDAEIPGATAYSYTATASGDYHATFFVGPDSIATEKVTLVVNPLPTVFFTDLDPAYCEGGSQDTLLGSQTGGVFLGNGITDNTDGTAYFDPVITGTYDITYYFTDGNGCSDTSVQSVTVHPLPVVTFSGLAAEYCEGEDQDTLTGSQAGGFYLGTGITDNTDGTAYFDPITVGTYDITYYFTDGNTCSDTSIQSVTVHPLPVVDYTGLAADLCVMDDPDTLTGNQVPSGTFFGGTVADQGNGTGIFTPVANGMYDIYYAFTDVNGCRDSVMYSVTVHPLPVVSIGNYDTIYDVNDPAFFIAGSPLGGTFSGKGISGITYDPALAGAGFDTVVYTYTDGNSCSNSDTIIFEIRDYDFKTGARYLWDIDNWCSPDGYYTTTGATPDESNASCFAAGPNNNRWFMFRATTDQVHIKVLSGGAQGTNRNPEVALWTTGGIGLACARYWDSSYDDIEVGYIGLTPGTWYYISVDNYPGRDGSFTLCVDDAVDYDFLEGAITVPHTSHWRSADGEYTTFNATPDRIKGDCWNTNVNSNRWFTFTALKPTVTVDVLTGGLEGTMRYSYGALWNEAGEMVACARYSSEYGDIRFGVDTLTVGATYYISVDHNDNNGYDGTFTLAVDDDVDYDFRAGAIEIPHTGGWRSADGIYTTLDATADGTPGSCWANGPNFSRWFKFQATTNEVTAEMLTGGTEGDLRYAFLVLVDTFGTELACARYYFDYSDIKLGYAGLIPGEWYYLIADNHGGSTGYRGTFSMALDNIVDYDFREGAISIPHMADWCSADAAYTTLNASPDGDAGSCWPNGPTFNRWFTFTATTTEALIRMKTGGDEGTLRYGLVALWDDSGTELACGRYSSDYSDINVGYTSLVPGNTYYISVDNHNGSNGYRGTFTLCLDNEVDYDFPLGAVVLSDLNNWCSPDAAYTTIDASGDTLAGSCWPNGPTYDRWFRFQATTDEVLVRMKTGGTEGTLRYGMVALWDASFNEVACNTYTYDYSDVAVGATLLTPGAWYYISVDNHNGSDGYRGTFSLCITDNVDYDFVQGAYEITDYDNWCSADAQFTTLGATADGMAGSCWPNGPSYNRWFRFQATGTEVMFYVKTGGDEGTLRYPLAALFDTLGNELACERYISDYGDISIGYTSLTPGEWYYLTVDNYQNAGYRGTFTLCADDHVDYDYKEGAEVLTNLDNWCSAKQAYTTLGASPDEAAGACWPNGPNFNRWFRFQATSSMVKATVKTGGDEGTVRYIMVAIWDSLGNELACDRYTSEYSDVNVGYTSLTPGEWYYISVDNYNNTGYRGTFTLCIDDTVDYDYVEAAKVIPSIVNYCSAEAAFSTLGASADRAAPSCWQNGPNYNRWFAFQATTTGDVTISLRTGGSEGTLRYGMLALWDTTLAELGCRPYTGQYDDLELVYSGLTPGEWYFVSVDNSNNAAYRGTFTLCMKDAISYDFFAGAIELTDIDGWCSDYAIYSTIGATPDEGMGSCWPNGPNYNRWFRFQATTPDIAIQVRTGGVEGSVRRPDIALWDTLKSELACARWVTDYGDEEIYATGLTVGDWYYISVDNASGGTDGTFTLCVTDHAVNDFMADAITIDDLNNWCAEDAQYSNVLATDDESQGSCWTGIENKNVWFRFMATSSKATVKVTTGGDYGQMVNQQVALWDALGTEVACAGPFAGQGELTMLPTGMTIGDWYYISIDDDGTPGTFSICVDDTIDYDYPEGAFEIIDPGNWCSPEAAFSNAGATADMENGSCWNGSNFQNVWFTFIAPAPVINIRVSTGTTYGNMDRQQIALFDESLNEVACAGPDILQGTRNLQIDTLTPGNRYYIAVDNGESGGGNTGTFTLCTDTVLTYDFRAGALEVPHNYCSDDAEFTLVQATADEGAASCWSGPQLTNVWFKFQATTPYVTVSLKSAGVYGDLRRGQMAIWNEAGEEVTCRDAVILEGTLLMLTDTLTVGSWYYIAVDMNETGANARLGSFSLCLEDALDYDFQAGALVLDHNYGCSAEEAFTNGQATDDGGIGSCWGTSNGNQNVWFVFQATTPYAKVQLKTGNFYGTMRRAQMAMFNEDDTEVACTGDLLYTGTTVMMVDSLTVGNWYWISVDDNQSSGTFTLCLEDELDYDYLIGALEIPHDFGCSADAEFSNLMATDDELPGGCWGTYNTNKNVWFKFQATTPYATVQIKTGSVYGNMRRAQMAMWDATLNEVLCVGDIVDQGLTEMVIDTLTVGNWYYISVDDDYQSGTFTFCLDNELTYDYIAGAEEIPHDMGCSFDAAYTNYYGSADESPGSCWGTYNSLKNVWFRFQATSRFLTFKVKTGSIYGNMRRAQMAVFNEAGVEVACIGDILDQGTTTLSADTLTVGNYYYIAVDDDYQSGSFSICISDQPTFDYWEGAIELTSDYGCSADAQYTNLAATPDMLPGSCWGSYNGLNNVWFKFQATTPNVTVDVKTGSVYGYMRRAQVAIWTDAFTEVACVGDLLDQGTTTVSMDTLTVGNWYYISVDDDYQSGSFTICVSDEATYDFFGGALELLHNGGCSSDAAYSNYLATADRSMASCWTGVDPVDNKNVWFKFQAITTDVTLTIRNFSVYGNMRYPQAALWTAAGAEVKCLPRTLNQNISTLSYDGLTVGDWYYISVDDANTSGSFTLCIDDQLDYDYKAGAYEIVNPIRWCSSDAQFNNYFGTPDELPGSCWAGGENKNVWFKFTAISRNVKIGVKNGTTLGSLTDLQASLWNENGEELDCSSTEGNTTPITLASDSLTIGNTYYISVDDSQNPGSFTLCVDADPLHVEMVATDVTCFGNDDGTIILTPEGGTGTGYGYSWTRNGVPYVGGSSITGLDPATYQVTVRDLGDPATTVVLSHTITEDPPLTLSMSGTNAGCPGDADGSVTATPGGGSGMGFTYTWYRNDVLIPDVTQTLVNVDSAEYRVIVSDFGSPTCTLTDSIVVSNTNTTSNAPTGFTVTNNSTCQGTSKVLTVVGGALGTGAIWNWSTDPAFSGSAGIGSSIAVNPAVTRAYYVRAEGLCNTTSAASGVVTVLVPSTDPTGITVTNDNTCVGTSKGLTVLGGSLGDGATWEWYSDATFTTNVGSGVTISVDPPVTTTYYVRAEGICGASNAVNTTVTVRTPSTDPAGISVTNDNTCQGTSKTLTVLGGSLGTGADWYWYSDAGFSMLVGSGNSVVVDPAVNTTYYVRAQGDCGNSNAASHLVSVLVPSTDPTSVVVGNDNTCPGTTKTLTVVGGSLGEGANWYWYSDATFTTLAGTGSPVGVDPLVTTTYYVRAEGTCGATNAVSGLVTVMAPSTDPTGINVTNNNTCPGTSKGLTVAGGSLGDDATWEWYSDATFTTNVGSGVSISVDPLITTTYYVRAEGTCGPTAAVNTTVSVLVPSTDPSGINVTNNNTCPGISKGLTVTGGSLGDGASWEWYSNAAFTVHVGSGVTISVDPLVTTTYYVRAEGTCGPSASVNATVTVLIPSTDPTGIVVTNDNTCPGNSKGLTVSGGSLGDGATWEWYSDATFTTNVGTGVTISVDPLVTTIYYVRAEGTCGPSAAVNTTVTVLAPSTDPTGINVTNNNTCPGTSKDLTVIGGSLGDGATWEWYSNAALTANVGSGVTISVDPLVTTTYYVRAEGTCGPSTAVNTTVTVLVPSTYPTSILVSNDNTCPGTSKDLTVVGGSLGTGASWEWYSDAGFITNVGSGVTISVDPLVSTTYYVRAEGTCGVTNAVSGLVTVLVPSTDPTGFSVTNNNTCPGTSKILTVAGGSLGTAATWEWYSNAAFTINVGSGLSISVDPLVTTIYYVRAEGTCGVSNAASGVVTVIAPSTDPTGFTVSNNNTCPGTSKVLSVVGGSLGDGATWEWYNDASFTTNVGNGVSISVDPLVTTTYYVRAEGTCGPSNAVSGAVTVLVPSTDPTGITVTNDNTCSGTSKDLTVTGGSLGDGATWEWYTDATFTTNVGSGVTINVDPLVTTTYYVRAEGTCGSSNAVNVAVNVLVPSTDPTGINLTNNNTCPGTSKDLTVTGGSLGDGATWEWYTDATFTTNVGSGVTINVDPLVTTTYYVRAEGTCGPSNAVNITVTVLVPSTDPTGITVTNDNTCPGTAKDLTVIGGNLGDGATWEWYSDASFTTNVGNGVSISVDPLVTTTYYVRAEGTCGPSAAVNTTVTVLVPSTDPTGITVTNDNTCPGTSKDLTVVGGSLGDGATWEWYTDATFTTNVGSGVTINADPLITTSYYVRAEGTCGPSATVNQIVTVKIPSVSPAGVSITNNNTCYGTAKQLTLVGGMLGTGATWEWYEDEALTISAGSGVSITVDPALTTTYYLRAEGDCNVTDTIQALVMVSIESIPADSIEVINNNTCIGTGIDLLLHGGLLGSGAQWQWYSDSLLTVPAGVGTTISVNPSVTTTYYVRAEGGCNFTPVIPATVTVFQPSADPTGVVLSQDNLCPGESTILKVSGGSLGDGATWRWYSDETLSTEVGSGDSLEIMPDSSTRYYVRAEGFCNMTDTISMLVNVKVLSEGPDLAEADTSSICIGEVDSIRLSYTGGILGTGANAYWYDDPSLIQPIDSGSNIIVPAPTVTTEYFVRFEGSCNMTDAVSVQVKVGLLPEPVIVGDTVVCESGEGIFSVSGTSGSGFAWTVIGGEFSGDSTGNSVSMIWSGAGTGSIGVTETNPDGCSAFLEQTVTIHPSPSASEIRYQEGVVCAGDERSYYIEGLENSGFEWVIEEGTVTGDFGDSVIIHWDIPAGTYEISVLEISENGCRGDTLRLSVTVEGPVIDLGGDALICKGDLFTIDLTGQYETYLWQDGSTGPVFSTDSSEMIRVQVGDGSGCTASDQLYLEVHELPMVDLGNDTTLCGDHGMILDAGPDGIVYNWSTGDNSQEIIVFMGERQQISVIVTDEFGCSSSDTIIVEECDAAFYFRDIPTAITPNGDGVNDVWNIVKLAGYSRAEVEIFNRWGTLVWRSEPGYSVPWDGLDMNGNPVPMDSYHFVIKLNVGSKDRITGLITVIK